MNECDHCQPSNLVSHHLHQILSPSHTELLGGVSLLYLAFLSWDFELITLFAKNVLICFHSFIEIQLTYNIV